MYVLIFSIWNRTKISTVPGLKNRDAPWKRWIDIVIKPAVLCERDEASRYPWVVLPYRDGRR
jgi:hypothetical protein